MTGVDLCLMLWAFAGCTAAATVTFLLIRKGRTE